ncbi:MAG: hypothetical protein M3317_09425 [Actinomycetota bacterium]|nr:hypothetical protein [Actinomycetota bacterium]
MTSAFRRIVVRIPSRVFSDLLYAVVAESAGHYIGGLTGRLAEQAEKRREMNIRQANGIGRVHVAKPQLRETYCGRPINDEDWVTTTKEANCTGCARAGAPGQERTTSARR